VLAKNCGTKMHDLIHSREFLQAIGEIGTRKGLVGARRSARRTEATWRRLSCLAG
jgi:hypothetical protein